MTSRKLLYSLVALAFIAPAALLIGQDQKKDDPAQEMLETAREAYKIQFEMRRRGEIGPAVDAWSDRLLEAELLVAKSADERRAAIKQHIERTAEMLELHKRLVEALEGSKLDVLEWQYRLAAAKQMLADVK
jgi:hypothetical protein